MTVREFVWLTEAETMRLRNGFAALKRGDEGRWVGWALFPLAASPILAAQHEVGFGLFLLWFSKFALQGMIHRGFFDPRL